MLRVEQVKNLAQIRKFFRVQKKKSQDRGEPTETLDLLIQLMEVVQLFYLFWLRQHKCADSSKLKGKQNISEEES